MNLKSTLTTLSTSCLLITSTASRADDTDIFLSNPNYDSSIKPNVLFILDNSGSMDWALTRNDDARNGEKSRMDVMQESFEDILRNASNINAGLMKLHSRNNETTRLTFPVTDIDTPFGSSIQLDGTPTLVDSTDDAQENTSDNSVSTTSEKLTIGLAQISAATNEEINKTIQFPVDNAEGTVHPSGEFWFNTSYFSMYYHPQHDYQKNALYFRDLGIPSGATIQEATVTFTAAESNQSHSQVKISAEKAKSPLPLDQKFYSDRNKTSQIDWDVQSWSSGSSYDTIDISSIIQEVLDDSSLSWTFDEELDNLALFFETTYGDRQAYKNNASTHSSYFPKLYIKYSVSSQNIDNIVGVRFQSVGIPQGSTVESADIEFTAAEDDNSPVLFEIRAGIPTSSNNAFAQSSANLSSRNKTNSIDWNPGTWTVGSPDSPNRYSANVKNLLQDVVNNSNWCGNDSATFYLNRKANSGNGRRVAHAIDGVGSKKARLVVTYTPSPNGGCKNEIISTRLQANNHDGFERLTGNGNNRNRVYLYDSVEVSTSRMAALHYPNLPLQKDADIIEAYIELTASSDESGSTSIEIRAEDTDNSLSLTSQKRNISNRSGDSNWTSQAATWSISEDWEEWTTYKSPDIQNVLEEVISQDSWQAGNNLTLLLKSTTGSNRKFISHDDHPSYSARLVVKTASGGIDSNSGYKVKDHLISLVNNMSASGGTPIVPTMYDAAQYFTGNSSPIVNSCQFNHFVLLTDGQANSDTSDSKSGIANMIGSSCTGDSNNDGEECGRSLAEWLQVTDLKDNIDDTNNITTHTIAFATQTDDQAKKFMEDIAEKGGGGFYTPSDAQELSAAFNKIINAINDKESTFASPGVAANSFNRAQHLNKIYYSVFKPALTDRWQGNLKKYQILQDSGKDTVSIYDNSNPPKLAVNDATGFFAEETQSFWSTEQDGNSVTDGGAASRFQGPNKTQRLIYTFLGTNPAGTASSMTSSANLFNTGNTSLLPDHFGLDSNNISRKDELINWARNPASWMGDPLHSTPALANYRCANQTIDNLFECSEDNLELALFVASNDGMLHVMNSNPAENASMEYFSFMPKELIPNLDALEKNGTTSRVAGQQGRPYGLDGDIVLWINDKNGNGVIYGGADTLDYDNNETTKLIPSDTLNPGEFVYAYIGMRRGGRSYYALDVTDLSTPKMLWYINGGEGDFTRLGQTWARPIRTKIKIGRTPGSNEDKTNPNNFVETKDVLVFSGGYSQTQDNTPLYQSDSVGNAVYIVDAKTGTMLWSASPDSSASLTLSKMQYSIPGGVSLADMEGDGYPDQIFFGDTGGQLWRLYINQCIPAANNDGSYSNNHCAVTSSTDLSSLVWPSDSDGNGTWTADEGVIAYTGYATTPNTTNLEQSQNARKFYTRPDITTFVNDGKLNLGVAIGSGKRSDPLGRVNQHTKDHFYFVTSTDVFGPVLSADSLSNNYKTQKKVPGFTTVNVFENDLVKVSYSSTNGVYSTSIPNNADTLANGWYVEMEATTPGLHEKVMSNPTVYNSTISFNSYSPSANATTTCSAVTGNSWAWELSMDGSSLERKRINTNGIVGNSVFIRLSNESLKQPEPDTGDDGNSGNNPDNGSSPDDGENPDDGNTPDEGNSPDDGNNSGAAPPPLSGSKCLMFRGLDAEIVPCPEFEGSSYWRQVR